MTDLSTSDKLDKYMQIMKMEKSEHILTNQQI